MKWGLLALALALTGCGDQQNVAGSLPAFEFRGLKAKITTVDEAQSAKIVSDCRPSELNDGRTGCLLEREEIGEIPALSSIVVFKDNKFDWFTLGFSTLHFEQLLDQTRRIYGEPCSMSSTELQNGFGAKFTGDVVEWCFAEGNLTVSRHMKVDYRFGEFEFFTNHPDAPHKKLDPTTI